MEKWEKEVEEIKKEYKEVTYYIGVENGYIVAVKGMNQVSVVTKSCFSTTSVTHPDLEHTVKQRITTRVANIYRGAYCHS